MGLDARWVEAIHTKLTLTYGVRFMQQYAGLDPERVKADWAHQLTGVSAEGIKHALENLPHTYPVNVLQFRELCSHRRLPDAADVLIDMKPRPMTREQRELLSKLRVGNPRPEDPKAWARTLRDREKKGERLTPAQRRMWRDALRFEDQPTEA